MSKPDIEAGGMPAGLEGYETIGPSEVARLLGRTVKSVQVDATRRPTTLPPRFVVPGCSRIRFLKREVIEWMEALVRAERHKREEAEERQKVLYDFARRFPASGYKGSSRR